MLIDAYFYTLLSVFISYQNDLLRISLFLILVLVSVLQWQKRFFVLHSNKLLHYFKNEKDKRPVKDPINLAFCKSVESHLTHTKFKHVFSIATEQRTYFLVADSERDMLNWVEHLSTVCGFRRTDDNNSPGNVHIAGFAKVLYMYNSKKGLIHVRSCRNMCGFPPSTGAALQAATILAAIVSGKQHLMVKYSEIMQLHVIRIFCDLVQYKWQISSTWIFQYNH